MICLDMYLCAAGEGRYNYYGGSPRPGGQQRGVEALRPNLSMIPSDRSVEEGLYLYADRYRHCGRSDFDCRLYLSVEYRKAQYASYARQLYYSGLLYTATHSTETPYDLSDGELFYITDTDRLGESFPYGGEIRIAFSERGRNKVRAMGQGGRARFYRPVCHIAREVSTGYLIFPVFMRIIKYIPD